MTKESKIEEYTPLAFDVTNPSHVELIRQLIPDMRAIEGYQNPIMRVRFREGLLVMRELVIARIMSIKGFTEKQKLNWQEALMQDIWPSDWCGNDPGTPRRLAFQEIAKANKWLTQEEADRMNQQAREEGDDDHKYEAGEEAGWESIPIDPSIEALPSAHALLVNMGVMK